VRLALIANPGSGGGLIPAELAQELERAGAEVQAFPIDEAERVLGAGPFDRVVVAGGDGSVGLAAEVAGELGIPLALVPTGTANDFARAHDLPLDRSDAIALAVREPPRLERLELGRLGERPFVNVASAGLAPAAARHATRHKRVLGPLAYALGALQAGFTARPVACSVAVDGAPVYDGKAWQVIVSVSGAFGGGSSIEDADPGDGVLHVTVVPAGSRLGLVRRAVGMRRGDLAGQPGVVDAEGSRMELGLPAGAQLNVDGELCSPASLTVEPSAFSLVVG
jgi:diacylglycerol kinase family enzyme